MQRYGKVRGHHCWWLTKDGKSIANFDNESDVDAIISMESTLQRFNYRGQAIEHDPTVLKHTGNDVFHVQQALNA